MTRILQITDTHLVEDGTLAYGTVDTAAALQETVATINRVLPQIGPVDMAVVTGDLTDFGRAVEYRRFRDILSELAIPYRAVPGNHDNRETMRAAFADQDWMPKHGPIRWRAVVGALSLLALDTLVDGASHGALDAESLDWLEKQLSDLAPAPILVALHHPPVKTGILPMDKQNLRDAEPLKRLLQAYSGPCRIIAGHVHRSIFTDFGSAALIVAPGTSHAVTLDLRRSNSNSLTLEPGGIMLHEFDNGFRSHVLPVGAYAGPYPFSAGDEAGAAVNPLV